MVASQTSLKGNISLQEHILNKFGHSQLHYLKHMEIIEFHEAFALAMTLCELGLC